MKGDPKALEMARVGSSEVEHLRSFSREEFPFP